jgi:hypothetical protein
MSDVTDGIVGRTLDSDFRKKRNFNSGLGEDQLDTDCFRRVHLSLVWILRNQVVDVAQVGCNKD